MKLLHIGNSDKVGERYLEHILEEAKRLVKNPEELSLCSPKCAACLAADARSNVDERIPDCEYMGLEWGDTYMLRAKSILAKELNWELEGEEEKEIISKNKFSENEHKHLDDIKCPKCERGMKPLFEKSYLVGCMEYQLFLCDREYYVNGSFDKDREKSNCRILIINYPHESAGEKNKIIEF